MNERFRIFVAEDNPADADLVRRALLEHGINCELHVVGDGAEVIRQIGELDTNPDCPDFDLLILDMHLPKENGEAVLNCLRSTARFRQTPVVVMAAEDTNLIAKQDRHSRALSFFHKPSSLDEFMQLGALVRSILSVAKKPDSRWGSHDNRSTGAA